MHSASGRDIGSLNKAVHNDLLAIAMNEMMTILDICQNLLSISSCTRVTHGFSKPFFSKKNPSAVTRTAEWTACVLRTAATQKFHPNVGTACPCFSVGATHERKIACFLLTEMILLTGDLFVV
jgi:hypothetical protein